MRPGPGTMLGPGDDAAVLAAPDGRVVATTDFLLEGRHFRRDWAGPADIGHRAAVRSLADVAAMGAVATALLVAFAAPPDLPAAWALGVAEGLAAECARAGASVAGGDVARFDAVLLAVTGLGDLQGRNPVTRSGARPARCRGGRRARWAVRRRAWPFSRPARRLTRRPAPAHGAGRAGQGASPSRSALRRRARSRHAGRHRHDRRQRRSACRPRAHRRRERGGHRRSRRRPGHRPPGARRARPPGQCPAGAPTRARRIRAVTPAVTPAGLPARPILALPGPQPWAGYWPGERTIRWWLRSRPGWCSRRDGQ